MALPQLLQWVSGKLVGLNPLQASAGSASAGAIPALNSSGLIDQTMLPPTTQLDGGNSSAAVAPELPVIDGGTS